ncbi:vitamin K epoxide reductase family protein [Candidatus Pacearchaeota archaeon]|nr:vitamin K epoxide reductase family protein [Candidatus Pacearchaeota archaeon]
MKEVFLILLAVFGFAVSFYIWNKVHREKKKLFCIIGKGTCESVVKSKYAHLFGMDNAVIGMAYYFFIFAAAVFLFAYPKFLLLDYVSLSEKFITGAAALVSLILISIQLFVLKQTCEYCMVANATNIAIFMAIILL